MIRFSQDLSTNMCWYGCWCCQPEKTHHIITLRLRFSEAVKDHAKCFLTCNAGAKSTFSRFLLSHLERTTTTTNEANVLFWRSGSTEAGMFLLSMTKEQKKFGIFIYVLKYLGIEKSIPISVFYGSK